MKELRPGPCWAHDTTFMAGLGCYCQVFLCWVERHPRRSFCQFGGWVGSVGKGFPLSSLWVVVQIGGGRIGLAGTRQAPGSSFSEKPSRSMGHYTLGYTPHTTFLATLCSPLASKVASHVHVQS
jgi:hypothetical protein